MPGIAQALIAGKLIPVDADFTVAVLAPFLISYSVPPSGIPAFPAH
jgi:hypothetical protein